MAAQQVERLSSASVLTDDKIELLAIARRLRSRAAAVVHDMVRITWQQQDVASLQLQRRSTSGIFQQRRTADDRVIRDLVRLAGSLPYAPGRAIEAAQIEPASHGHHVEQSTQPIHRNALLCETNEHIFKTLWH
jgi:hypothetical protein